MSIVNENVDLISYDEAKDIFNKQERWDSKKALVASIISYCCGLTIEEILGLQIKDIGENYLRITDEAMNNNRLTPLPAYVRSSLMDLIRNSFYTAKPDVFIFSFTKPDIQHESYLINYMFMQAMRAVKLFYKKPNISFASLRLSHNKLLAAYLTEKQTQILSSTYTDKQIADNALREIVKITTPLFNNLLT